MAIDFQSSLIAGIYASCATDGGWAEALGQMLDVTGKAVADIGRGGGIYSTALSAMGAAYVTGIDVSAQMTTDVEKRRRRLAIDSVEFRHGRTDARIFPMTVSMCCCNAALIHHLAAPHEAFVEAQRILRPGGTLLVQDRTLDDVTAPASARHFRAWFFEFYPQLLEVEHSRRPTSDHVATLLAASGFAAFELHTVWEQRRSYSSIDELRSDLLARDGRSILHELTDPDLEHLADDIRALVAAELNPDRPICELDRWTIWKAQAVETHVGGAG